MKKNNFDLFRLVLTLVVLWAHARIVGVRTKIPVFDDVITGSLAVQSFFVVSAFLIFPSWERSRSWRDYASKRLRRIFPAYAVVVVLATFGLALITSLSVADYFGSTHTLRYLVSNLLGLNFLEPTLPGVFADSAHHTNLVNGPLWTIKIEAMFYASIPLILWAAGRSSKLKVFGVLYVAAVCWRLGFTYLAEERDSDALLTLARQLPGQLSFFVAGGAIFYYHDWFKTHINRLLPAALVGLTIHFTLGAYVIFPAALAIVVLYLTTIAPYAGNFGRYGDISYGLYIFHYPIYQTLQAVLGGTVAPYALLGLGVALAIAASFASWHFVEKRALPKSSHYLSATQSGVGRPSARSESSVP